jgi:hypothetical protein
MTLYAVCAAIEVAEKGSPWSRTKDLPTFLLNGATHGLPDEAQAREFAKDMIRDMVTAGGNEQALKHIYINVAEV